MTSRAETCLPPNPGGELGGAQIVKVHPRSAPCPAAVGRWQRTASAAAPIAWPNPRRLTWLMRLSPFHPVHSRT